MAKKKLTTKKPAAKKSAAPKTARRPAPKKAAPKKPARAAKPAKKPAAAKAKVVAPKVQPRPPSSRSLRLPSRRFLDQKSFQRWLQRELNPYLYRFLAMLPDDTRAKLDFSPGSLDVVEAWLIHRYPSPHPLMLPGSLSAWQGAAAYIGETMRRILGGQWSVDLKNEQDLYFDRPVLDHFPGCVLPICPELLTSLVLERRSGHELLEVLEANRPASTPPPAPPTTGSMRTRLQ